MEPAPDHRCRRVYLSGGMEYAANEGRDWRSTIQEWLERRLCCTVFNPNLESENFFRTHAPGVDFRALKLKDPLKFKELVARVVDIDCREIAERSDYVVCLWDEAAMRGAGTKGELTLARFFGKPVYMVTHIPLTEIPGWVLGCTTELFPDFTGLQSFLSTGDD
jgi:hypothetical protein